MTQFSDDLFLGPAETYMGTGLRVSGAVISGTIAGTTLTVVTYLSVNRLEVGQYVTGSGVTANSSITADLGNSKYTLSQSSTVASPTTMYVAGNGNFNDPSPMSLGVGPIGRTYVWDVIPETLQTANIAASQTPVAAGALTLTAGTSARSVLRSDGTRVIQLDCPRAVSVTTSGATGGDVLAGVTVTGTAGQISFTPTTGVAVNEKIVVTGTNTGTSTGIVAGTYYVTATNGTTTATLSSTVGGPGVVTTAGTTAGGVLGTASSFPVLAASAITNTGSTAVTGNIGIYPGTAITGFPPGTVSGVIHNADVTAQQAQVDALAAYTAMAALASTATIATALDGQTLTSTGVGATNVYTTVAGTMTLAQSGNGTLTLSGDATSIFILRTASTLTTGAGGTPTITLTGGAVAANVYWIIGSSATINSGNTGTFKGNILAQVSITDTLGGTVSGNLIALTGAVTISAAATIATTVTSTGLTFTRGVASVITTITGWDYYGQPMTQAIASSSSVSTTVAGLKAFYQIGSVSVNGVPDTAITVGTTDVLGIPVRVIDAGYVVHAGWANTLADNAGTFVPADMTNPATGATGDVRGTYVPSSASNGSNRLVMTISLSGIAVGPNANRAGALGVTQA